jgi:Fe/S biogenesis protein NfuA
MTDIRTALPVVTVTERARGTILGLRAAEAEGEALALRIEITGEAVAEYVYELTFEAIAEAGPDDVVGYSGDLAVLVPAGSIDRLRGATLDEVDGTGLVLRNPNRPTAGLAPAGASYEEGTVEHRIQSLLDVEINPMLASHGGFTTLDHVEGDVAYMFMGGGCQGCGLAKLTLTEGIKATIEREIDEIREVVDITDHTAGENPFYESAK